MLFTLYLFFLLFRLDDIKNLVSQLYEALNVQDHHVSKELELSTQIETLKQELLPLEEVSERAFTCDMKIKSRRFDI